MLRLLEILWHPGYDIAEHIYFFSIWEGSSIEIITYKEREK